MNWLLKIVEGPVKGAEIALVDGMRLKVGSAETCDIVLSDSTIADEAFELDVAAEAVTFIADDGSAAELVPFEIKSVGTTSFAVGPAEGDWKALVRREVAKETVPSEPPPTGTDKEDAVTAPVAEAATVRCSDEKPKKSRKGIGCLVSLVILILLGVAAWYFWPKIAEKVPQVEMARVWTAEKTCAGWAKASEWARIGCDWAKAKCANEDKPAEAPSPIDPRVALQALADEYQLKLNDTDGGLTLSGNCQRRTERLAIRALAQAIDEAIKFDLTDDETLRESSNELLFALTGGSLKAIAATNRVVTMVGYSETSEDLRKALVSLNADVKGIDRVDTAGVKLGIVAPEVPLVPSPAESIVDKAVPDVVHTKPVAKVTKALPVAGILMKPYPCVVMRSGLRLSEGSELGPARIVKIMADRIVLRDGGAEFEWRP